MATSGKHSWIENSDVFSLFPTLVWKTQLRAEVHEAIDASALELLRSLRQGLPEPSPDHLAALQPGSLRAWQAMRRNPQHA